jgi:hypothetical protein
MDVNMSKLKKPRKSKDPNALMRGKIISALRRLSWSCQAINNKYKKAKVAPSTYECNMCRKWCYNGKSNDAVAKLQEQYPDKHIEASSVYRDHLHHVVPIIKGWKWDWNDVINNMLFCSEDSIQIICYSCNYFKTQSENELRKKLRNDEEI